MANTLKQGNEVDTAVRRLASKEFASGGLVFGEMHHSPGVKAFIRTNLAAFVARASVTTLYIEGLRK